MNSLILFGLTMLCAKIKCAQNADVQELNAQERCTKVNLHKCFMTYNILPYILYV